VRKVCIGHAVIRKHLIIHVDFQFVTFGQFDSIIRDCNKAREGKSTEYFLFDAAKRKNSTFKFREDGLGITRFTASGQSL